MKSLGFLCAIALLTIAVWAAEQKTAQPMKPAQLTPSEVAPAAAAPKVVQSDEPTRIQVDVTRVSMLFTVTDRKGRFITDLTKDDFAIIEGKRPQAVLEFIARHSNLKLTPKEAK